MSHKLQFRIIHASSQDDTHKAIELSNHTPGSKGWKSLNFCIYPQDVVISLNQRCQLKKIQLLSHQYLIATKVEFFVADCPDNTLISLNNAHFTRLGYVSLSDNEQTQFKARELKSVHVDAIGRFVKLTVHKNFINKHNLYNQVGIIAINVIGHEISSSAIDNIDNIDSNIIRQGYIPSTEDLAFDMSIDTETAQLIRKLEKVKQNAVANEEFDRAKKIRDTIAYLEEMGEKVGKLEVEKRNAIENENYDRAKLKKQQIDQYRQKIYREIDQNDLLNDGTNRRPLKQKEVEMPEYESYKPHMNDNNNALVYEGNKTYRTDDRPLPVFQKKSPRADVISPRKIEMVVEPIDMEIIIANIEEVSESVEIEDGVIPGMSKIDISEASDAIEVYGMPLVSKLYSKKWSHIEDGLLEIKKRLSEMPSDSDKDDVRAEIKAATCVMKKALKNRVTQVVQVAMTINRLIMGELIDRLGIPKHEVHFYLDKIVPEIFKCTEDNKVQIKDLTFPHLIEMSQWEHVKEFPHIFSESVKPFSPTILVKPGVIKSELLLELYSLHGLCNVHFSLDNFMKYATQALQHRSAEVRESAETLVVVLYRNEDKQAVRSYLPPDDMKTRKNVLFKRLFQKLDKIDDLNPGFSSKLPIIQEIVKPVERETRQPKPKPNQVKAPVASNKKLADKRTTNQPPLSIRNNFNPTKTPQTIVAVPQPPTPFAQLEAHDDLLSDLDKTCIFCGEKNDEFRVNMDLHYWKNCPILRRCPYCKQAVEISTLTQHLLQECDQHSLFGQCNRCSEAILKTELDQHVTDALCNPTQPNCLRCPLCHDNLTLGANNDSPESLWQYHLMDESNGCPQNPRRLFALQRKRQQSELVNKGDANKTTVNNRKSQLPRAKGK